MKRFNLFVWIIVLSILGLSSKTEALEQNDESWMFIWSVTEIDDKNVILITKVKKVNQQKIGDQELVDKFKKYYKDKGISVMSEPVIVSRDTKKEAVKDRENRISNYEWDDSISLAKDFVFTS
jgi:hypothetical protein